jgi:hypothetical protein
MNTRYKLNFEVIGYKSELSEFLKLLAYIERCGNIGHSGTIKVCVDGDGTGRLTFSTPDNLNIYSEVYSSSIISEIDNKDQSIYIGE